MRTHRLIPCVALLLTVAASAHEANPAGFGERSPDAPAETAQFSFLIGEWRCATRSMAPDGGMREGPEASWTGYYILDGWAIQDDWVSPAADGGTFRGTNIRSYNPQTARWDNRWLPTGTLEWKYFEAEQVGETMVMTGGAGSDSQGRRFLDRNTFYEIGDEAWKWRKDRSFDEGESWIEGVAFIDCREASAPATE